MEALKPGTICVNLDSGDPVRIASEPSPMGYYVVHDFNTHKHYALHEDQLVEAELINQENE